MELIKGKKGDSIFKIKMPESEYRSLGSDYLGICLKCGYLQDSCEPDAREYQCDDCESERVYGIEELLVMGRLEIDL